MSIPGVAVYLDEILVTAPTDEEHVATLAVVLQRLLEAGLHFKKEKCLFLAPSMVYLEHVIDTPGLHPIKAVLLSKLPGPTHQIALHMRNMYMLTVVLVYCCIDEYGL